MIVLESLQCFGAGNEGSCALRTMLYIQLSMNGRSSDEPCAFGFSLQIGLVKDTQIASMRRIRFPRRLQPSCLHDMET